MQLPNDFNCEMYRKHYSDLKHLTDDQVKEHYINHGIYEGRRYSDELPQCIVSVVIDRDALKSIEWCGSVDTRFSKEALSVNALKRYLSCAYNKSVYNIDKNFLVYKNNTSNIVMFRVSKKDVFISDVTHYDTVEAVYSLDNKKLIISDPKRSNYFIELITIFTNLVNKYINEYEDHILNKKNITFSSFIGVKQIMHHYINELSGLWHLLSELPLSCIYSQFEYYGKHENILNKKLKNTIIKRNINVEDLFLQTCKNNLFFVKQCEHSVPKELNDIVINNSLNIRETPLIFKNYNKCILFTVRNSHRKLLNQVGFIVTCIKEIHKRYPNSIYLIDGISKLYNTELTENSKCIELEKNTYLQICERLKKCNLPDIKIHSLIFEPIDKFINYVQYVDYYIAHIGTCQHKLGYFSEAKGIVHGGGESKFVAKNSDGWYWADHFGQVCTCMSNDMFNYEDVKSYVSNYTADLEKVREWAKSIQI